MRKYRARRRRTVPLEEQDAIVELYLEKKVPQKDVARRFRVTERLVSDLVREARHKAGKKHEAKMKLKQQERERAAIVAAAGSFLESSLPITKSRQISEAILASENLVVRASKVRRVLKQDLDLSYVKAKKVHPQANTDRALVQRQ